MDALIFLVLLAIGAAVVVSSSRRQRQRAEEQRRAQLEPVRKLAFEDVTALGEELQQLDVDLAGRPLDAGERADYQRALDAYESAKTAADGLIRADDVRHVTQILDDGRYAMACVRARVDGRPLPTRRPPCFFDPRHGTAVTEVSWTPPGGTPRDVPACALDAERVRAGAEPDVRQVMVGARRVPYWQGGPMYQPYARGYFGGFAPMDWMFMGMLFGGGFDGIGLGIGEGIGALGDGLGEGIGAVGDGIGDVFGGIGDGIGDVFGDIGDLF
ncbi:MAG: hypothetical protein ACTHNS_10685 [Marmoricola sp.]